MELSTEIPPHILDRMKKRDGRIELTGYLGRDPELRETQEKTFVVDHVDECRTTYLAHGASIPEPDMIGDQLAEDAIPYGERHTEITRLPRDYAVMSLGVHDGPKTTWYSLRVFNIDPHHPQSRYTAMLGIRIAKRGDQVQVKGRKKTWTSPGPNSYTLKYIDVEEFRILRTKRPR